MIFAKNIKVHSMLRMNWNEYIKTREYYAVTEGKPSKKEGTIVSFLKENKNNIVYSTHDPSGQKAITHYAVVKESAQYALVRVQIDTGRKNQIRVQFKDCLLYTSRRHTARFSAGKRRRSENFQIPYTRGGRKERGGAEKAIFSKDLVRRRRFYRGG